MHAELVQRRADDVGAGDASPPRFTHTGIVIRLAELGSA